MDEMLKSRRSIDKKNETFTDAPLIREKTNSFLTSVAPKPQTINTVVDLHDQINGMIDQLNSKVERVIEKHDNQFLYAYRNHIKKIRKELDDFRISSQKSQTTGALFRVSILEKELALMREQVNKLFEKLEARNRQYEVLKINYDQAAKENRFLEAEVKRLIKRQKQDAVNKTVAMTSIDSYNSRTFMVRRHEQSVQSLRKSKVIEDDKQFQHKIEQLTKNDDALKKDLTQLANQFLDAKNKTIHQLKSKYNKVFQRSSNKASTADLLNTRTQLQSFFLDCVETVRREILRRLSTKQDYSRAYVDFSIFKMQDKFKVLALFVQNDQVLKAIHDKMFNNPTVTETIDRVESRQKRHRSFRFSQELKK